MKINIFNKDDNINKNEHDLMIRDKSKKNVYKFVAKLL